jgi:hypothetical protein
MQFKGSVPLSGIDIDKTFTYRTEITDGNFKYIVIPPNITTGSEILVIDVPTGVINTNTEFTNSFINYVSVPDPKATLRAVTVGATTFVLNTSVTVTMKDELSHYSSIGFSEPDPADGFEASSIYLTNSGRISVDVGQYNRDYIVSVVIDGVTTTVTHTTPASTAGSAEANIATNKIAEEIESLINAQTAITDKFFVVRKSDEIMLYPKEVDLSYSISSQDGTGGGAMNTSDHNSVASFTKLPTSAAPNSIYTVTGASGDVDDIYMRMDVSAISTEEDSDKFFQRGTWVETLKPDIKYIIDELTMPHLLVQYPEGIFAGAGGEVDLSGTRTLNSWANKAVGDNESDKLPAFIGNTITDLATFQDRLVVLTGESVVMSVTTDFFNFWKKTVNTLLSDGPIGMSAISNRVNILKYVTTHNDDLIIFSDKQQYRVRGTPAITPQTATMNATTSFNTQTSVRPVNAGKNLFFSVASGAYSGIREFYTDGDIDANNAASTTIAVERYINGKVREMTSSTNLNKLIVLAEEPNVMYVYEYLWEQNEKIQEAWSKWVIDPSFHILTTQFRDDSVDVIIYRDGRIDFLVIDINSNKEIVGFQDLYIDYKTTLTVTSPEIILSTMPLGVELVVVQGEGCPHPGLTVGIESYDGLYLRLTEDMTGGEIHIGVPYTSAVKPSMPRVWDDAGLVIGTSSLTLGEMFINFIRSGVFDVEVIGEYNYVERNSGRTLGEESATIGEYKLTTGQLPVPIRQEADKAEILIRTDSPYPLTVIDIEWEGQFYKRGKRIARPRG